jgi:hypothetical protein
MIDPAPIVPMSVLENRFLVILDRHQGSDNAIKVADMAEQLGLGHDKYGERLAQKIKKHLVEEHLVCIGSSCGEPYGWYQAVTQAEIDATLLQYEHRLKSLSHLIARMKKSTPAEILRQQALTFEQEAIPA